MIDIGLCTVRASAFARRDVGLRAWCLAIICALGVWMLVPQAAAQQAPATAAKPAVGQQQAFPTPQALFEALVTSIRNNDVAAFDRILGPSWRQFIPTGSMTAEEFRQKFLEELATGSKINAEGDAKAVLEVGTKGWTFPIPAVKGPNGWTLDIEAGRTEMIARAIGRNELSVIQAMGALVDAQEEYAEMDPMKTGTTQYARRILSSPGKRDGLYWPDELGEPQSPLGDLLATAQIDGVNRGEGYFGYNFRMLYSQGANGPGGAREYIVKGRMIGGFAFIAWPVRYGETGIVTYIVGADGVVYEKDLGPNTAAAAGQISVFNPDNTWEKSDTTP